jgi:hypothetical protein
MSSPTIITDPFFAKLLVDISARNTLFFTPRQLYYLLSKKLRMRSDNIPDNLATVWRLFVVVPILNPVFSTWSNVAGSFFKLMWFPISYIFNISRRDVGIIAIVILRLICIVLAILYAFLSMGCMGLSSLLIFLIIPASIGLIALANPLISTIVLTSIIPILVLLEAKLSTSRQFDRRARQKSIKVISILTGVLLSIGIAVVIVAKSLLPLGIMGICLGLNAAWLSYKGQQQQKSIHTANSNLLIDRTEFDTWLEKWMSINDRSTKLLPLPQTYKLPATTNPQVTAYSFDLAIVCDNPAIAQILISNNFHFENNCAILTIDGYPQSIFDGTMEILYRNPNLKVYAFHDCTPNGIKLARQLRENEAWFPNPAIPIIDVGILPRQIMDNIDVMTLQSHESGEISRQLHPDIRASFNRAELRWLDAGCYLELESFSTQKLIHILRRAISESRDLSAIEYGGMITMNNSGFYTAENLGSLDSAKIMVSY